MRCPFCNYYDTKVVDSRAREGGRTIRRRRECFKCQRRFTTREYIEHLPLWVIKRDGRREEFDREKLRSGLQLAVSKRPIPKPRIEDIVAQIETDLRDSYPDEVSSIKIGELVMKYLKDLDEVAYVRFASVYRNFQVKEEFVSEIGAL